MSVDFKVVGTRIDLDRPETYLNLANENAADLLRWLGIPGGRELYGEESARELAAHCRRRLWPEARNTDEGREAVDEGRLYICPRAPGRLQEYARDLLALCERAGDSGRIMWG